MRIWIVENGGIFGPPPLSWRSKTILSWNRSGLKKTIKKGLTKKSWTGAASPSWRRFFPNGDLLWRKGKLSIRAGDKKWEKNGVEIFLFILAEQVTGASNSPEKIDRSWLSWARPSVDLLTLNKSSPFKDAAAAAARHTRHPDVYKRFFGFSFSSTFFVVWFPGIFPNLHFILLQFLSKKLDLSSLATNC